jgi:murein hydrolase activator
MTRSRSKNNLLLFCLFLPGILLCQNGSRGSIKDLENKKKKITEEIGQINAMLNETKVNRKSSLGVLVNINMKLSKRKDLIRTIMAEIHVLDKDIARTTREIETHRLALEKLKRDYARMIVLAQRNQDSYSMMMFIFSSDNFAQAYSRLKYFQQYASFRRKQAAEIIKTQEMVTVKLEQLTAQLKEKNQLLGIEESEKKHLSEEKSEQEEVLTTLQKKENELKSELEKRKRDATELQLSIKRMIEAEIRRKAEEAAKAEAAKLLARKNDAAAVKKKPKGRNKVPPSSDNKTPEKNKNETEKVDVPALNEEALALSEDFSNNRGKLPWPVQKGIICEGYGEHEHPAIKGFIMFNNGLEICATRGMQARAVFDGEVTGIAVSPTGGKLVIIRHGEYLSVYSNLDDILVKTGQKVSVKQAIGTVKYDEDEGKTSMNLQIWKGQKTMDPAAWLANAR